MSATIKPRAPASKVPNRPPFVERHAERAIPAAMKRLSKSIDAKMDRLEKNLDRMLADQTKVRR